MSLVIPARDVAPFLPDLFENLAAQQEEGLEILFVESASRDATPELLAEYVRCDPRARLVRHPAPGLSVARNAGIEASRAPIVAFQDADDASAPERLGLLRKTLSLRPDVAAVSSWHEVYDARMKELAMRGVQPVEHDEIALFLPCRTSFSASIAAYRRSALDAVGGFDPAQTAPVYPEDHDMAVRLVRGGVRLACLPRFLYRIRSHPRSLTGRASKAEVRGMYRAMMTRTLGTDNPEEVLDHIAAYLRPRLDGRRVVAWHDWGRRRGAARVREAFARGGFGRRLARVFETLAPRMGDRGKGLWASLLFPWLAVEVLGRIGRRVDAITGPGAPRKGVLTAWDEEEAIDRARRGEAFLLYAPRTGWPQEVPRFLEAGLMEGESFLEMSPLVGHRLVVCAW